MVVRSEICEVPVVFSEMGAGELSGGWGGDNSLGGGGVTGSLVNAEGWSVGWGGWGFSHARSVGPRV